MTGTPSLEARVAALEATVAGLVQAEPEFMSHVRAEPVHTSSALTVSLTHDPTGITVAARDRPEAVIKLRHALAGHGRRQHDLQEAQRRQQRKAAGNTAT